MLDSILKTLECDGLNGICLVENDARLPIEKSEEKTLLWFFYKSMTNRKVDCSIADRQFNASYLRALQRH